MPPSPQAAGPNQLDVRGLRVILWILLGVSVLFALVAWLVHPLLEVQAEIPEANLLGILAVMVPMEYVAWRVVARNLRKTWEPAVRERSAGDPLPQAFVTQSLLGAALTCSIGFFAGIVVLMSGSLVALALALAAAGLIAWQLPEESDLTPT